jgi:phosphate transport system substrate-binding protein
LPPADEIVIDGSTTVFPVAQAMAEDFKFAHPDANPSVNKSGTGSGFQKFSRGEIDIAAASRPIDKKENAELRLLGIEYIEIPIAYDGVSVVVNLDNNWVDMLSMKELRKAWSSESQVRLWSDIRSDFPKTPIVFHGPSDNHGTFEYFTEAVNGRKDDIRSDCQKDQDYNPIIQAVAADKNAIAYVGFNFYVENRDKVKIVPIDSGHGPVRPSEQSIAEGTYTPLSRPLFLYVNKASYDSKPQVRAFVDFALSPKGADDVRESRYVVLPKKIHDQISSYVKQERTGTMFTNVAPGTKLADVYSSGEAGVVR